MVDPYRQAVEVEEAAPLSGDERTLLAKEAAQLRSWMVLGLLLSLTLLPGLWLAVALAGAPGIGWLTVAAAAALITRFGARRLRTLSNIRRDLQGKQVTVELEQTHRGRWRVRVAPHSRLRLSWELVEPALAPLAMQRQVLDELLPIDQENRRGRLSRWQRRRLARSALRPVATASIHWVLLALLAHYCLRTPSLASAVPLVFWSIPLGGIALLESWRALRLLLDAAAGDLQFVEGTLGVLREVRYTLISPLVYAPVNSFLAIHGVRSAVDRAVADALYLLGRQRYRLGYARFSRRALTLEPLEEAIQVPANS